ncbi:hypothetical protein [Hymenobacter pini]|uniref:hypothetical protein n=1 Tax=Hymenobacter pini TaxID=2880879 RepID=UPI001CF1EC09|nr:hypothetical protein [Hymenobacter pini]MCA8830667.1 hypothetical protein [Hymenobacter pini]
MPFDFWVEEVLEDEVEAEGVEDFLLAELVLLDLAVGVEDLEAVEVAFLASGFRLLGLAALLACVWLPSPPWPALISEEASDWLEVVPLVGDDEVEFWPLFMPLVVFMPDVVEFDMLD